MLKGQIAAQLLLDLGGIVLCHTFWPTRVYYFARINGANPRLTAFGLIILK